MPRTVHTASFLLVALLAVVVHGPTPGAAQSLEYGIPTMELHLELLSDGRMQVEERIRFRVDAGDFAEGYRRIPLGRRIEIEGVEVTSPDLEVEDLRVRRNRRSTEIEWSFPRRSASATFVLRYELEGALQSDEGLNIIDWDAVGSDWEVELEEVRITVRWPDFGLEASEIQVEPASEGRLTRGPAAATPADGGGWIATFEPGPVPAETSYRVRILFPERVEGVEPPPPPNPVRSVLLVLGALLGGLAPGLAAHGLLGRPRPARGHAGADAEAAGIPEVSYLSHGPMYWSQRVFPATLVSLARRGHVRLRRVLDEDGAEASASATATAAAAASGQTAGESLQVEATASLASDDLTDFERSFLEELDRHDSFEAFRADASPFRKRARLAMAESLEARGFLVHATGRANALMALGVLAVVAGPLWLALAPGARLLPGAEAFSIFLLGAAVGIGLMVAGSRRFDLTETGQRVRKGHAQRMSDLKTRIDEALKQDPRRAAEELVESLEWVLVEPRMGPDWFRGVERGLQDAGIELELPGWLEPGGRPQGSDDDTTLSGFLPLYLLVFHSTPGATQGSGGAASTFSGAGMGASGGFGGGGGGIR